MRVPIQWKITGLVVFILAFSLLILGIVLISRSISMEESELREKASLTARTVAELPGIAENLSINKDINQGARESIEKLRVINNAVYIVVLNMDRVRLTHPVTSKIGTVSEGEDEGPAFAEHSYTSKGEGELGTVIRAFVPIVDQDHRQVGVVITGYEIPNVAEMLFSLKTEILITAGLAI
ncbi:MAG TPA: hypothetical protein VEY51_10345, partial [Chondromyces sp.]|nr:hypothetical protein [Chondromyces sp.]